MKIDYEEHYNDAYWQGRKTYKDGQGREKIYHGPSLTWEGFSFIADTLAPLLPKGTLLDIGCSGGDLCKYLQGHNFDTYGVDISKYALNNVVPSMRDNVALVDITTTPKEITGYHSGKVFPEQFDTLISTDLLEHIYKEDLDQTFDWMLSKTKKFLFFCVATAAFDKESFVAVKGEPIPPEFEGTAVAGHVHVKPFNFWAKYFTSKKLTIEWSRMYRFQMRREQIPPWRDTMGWNCSTTFFLSKP